MKRKLLFAATLLASAMGFNAYAQTAQDVTDTYLVNPSFEILKAQDGNADVTVKTKLVNGLYGWDVPSMGDNEYQVESEASGSSSGFLSKDGGPIAPSDGEYYYFNRKGWASLNSELKTTTKQEVVPGKYYLVFDYKAADYSNNNNTGNNGTTIGVTVTATDEKVLGKINAERRAFSMANNNSNPQNNPYMQTAPWTQLGVYFEVEKASVLTFAVQQNMKNNGRSDIIYDNFKLYQIDGAENVNMTGLIANPSFEAGLINGWVNLGNQSLGAQGNNDFVKVGNYYAEKWHANGTLNFKQTITGLPSGKYSISATVYSEPEGTRLIANDKSTPVKATKGAKDPSQINVYSVEDVDVIDGNLVFGIEGTLTSTTWICVDDFQLTFLREFTNAELSAAAKEVLNVEITKVNAIIGARANVGEGAFQIPENAVTDLTDAVDEAQGVYDNAEASVEEVEEATETLKAAEKAYAEVKLNDPVEGVLYNIINVSANYDHVNKAVTFKSASGADLGGNTTSMGWADAPGSIYPQGVKFEAVDDVVNGYILSYKRADGKTVYVGTGLSTGLGDEKQLRPTIDKNKALTVKVAVSDKENVWYLYNTSSLKANGDYNRLGGNGKGDAGFFTGEANGYAYYDMNITSAAEHKVTVNILNRYGTLIVPFDAEIPAGIDAVYSVNDVKDNVLTLESEDEIKANTPYVIHTNEEEANGQKTITLSGIGAAYTDAAYKDITYKAGLLTGAYSPVPVPVNSYVLQTQKVDGKEEGVQAFYKVADNSISLSHYRAYLTYTKPESVEPIKALYFGFADDDATAIEAIPEVAEGIENAVFYNLAGQRVQNPTKGIYIVNGKKVLVK